MLGPGVPGLVVVGGAMVPDAAALVDAENQTLSAAATAGGLVRWISFFFRLLRSSGGKNPAVHQTAGAAPSRRRPIA